MYVKRLSRMRLRQWQSTYKGLNDSIGLFYLLEVEPGVGLVQRDRFGILEEAHLQGVRITPDSAKGSYDWCVVLGLLSLFYQRLQGGKVQPSTSIFVNQDELFTESYVHVEPSHKPFSPKFRVKFIANTPHSVGVSAGMFFKANEL